LKGREVIASVSEHKPTFVAAKQSSEPVSKSDFVSVRECQSVPTALTSQSAIPTSDSATPWRCFILTECPS